MVWLGDVLSSLNKTAVNRGFPVFVAPVRDSFGASSAAGKRNKKVSVHPCPEHLCVQDARRGEGARGATGGHQEVQAEQGVARCDGTMDMHEQRRRGWGLCTPLLFLPP
jgi:hypothetical protein